MKVLNEVEFDLKLNSIHYLYFQIQFGTNKEFCIDEKGDCAYCRWLAYSCDS